MKRNQMQFCIIRFRYTVRFVKTVVNQTEPLWRKFVPLMVIKDNEMNKIQHYPGRKCERKDAIFCRFVVF